MRQRPHRATLLRGATLLAAAPLLVACGNEPVHDFSDPGTVVGADGTPSASPSALPSALPAPSDAGTPRVDLARGTITRASLTPEQVKLYEDVLLFEETAKAKAEADGPNGSSGTGSLEDDPDEDDGFAILKPAGTQVAERFEISTSNGKVTSYALMSESGERVEGRGGRIFVDVEVEAPKARELASFMEELSTAVDAWSAKHGRPPFISSSFGQEVELRAGVMDDSVTPVELEMPEGIRATDAFRSNDEYSALFESEATAEKATITQDGTTYRRSLEVV